MKCQVSGNLFWSAEPKDQHFVWLQNRTVDHQKSTMTSVKHGGGIFMLWGCFSSAVTGDFSQSEWIMNNFNYLFSFA